MAKSREAYVDTSAFVAFMDASDRHHPLFARLFAAPPPLVTTPLVIAEGQGWFLRRFDGGRSLEFLAFIHMLHPLSIVPVGPTEIAAATGLLRRYSDQPLTLVDAAGLHVMAVRKSRVCWSTDRRLRLGGTPLAIDGN